jgi:catechol 2,3-dioxygenase-like lactoylglutathione lyase family enzyme
MARDPLVRVTGLDHVVLVVRDVERSVVWYRDVLGMAVEQLEEWRRGDRPFPSVRVDSATILDLVAGEPDGRNMDHLALVVAGVDLAELASNGSDELGVLGPPRQLSGARGIGTALYVRDPDGHKIELRTYP